MASRAAVCRLFELGCERDLEGIVAKWANGTYQSDGRITSWAKCKNPNYSQADSRHELFAAKHPAAWRTRGVKPATPALVLR